MTKIILDPTPIFAANIFTKLTPSPTLMVKAPQILAAEAPCSREKKRSVSTRPDIISLNLS